VTIAGLIFFVVQVWLGIGAVVAAVFLTIGMDRIDEDAQGAYVFRPLLIPGCLLIWPLVLWRWIILETGRDQWDKRHKPPRDIHYYVGMVLAVVIPLLIIIALMQRQPWPADFTPEQISTSQVSES